VVVPTLIGWQIQVRRNPLFISVADCSSTRQFDGRILNRPIIAISAALFHLRLLMASRGKRGSAA
jgi:hypothetical protein